MRSAIVQVGQEDMMMGKRTETALRLDTANLLRDLAGIASERLAAGEASPIVRKALRRATRLQGRPRMHRQVEARSNVRSALRASVLGLTVALVASSAYAAKIPPTRGPLSYEQGVCDGLRASQRFSQSDHLNVITTHETMPSQYFGCNSADPEHDRVTQGVDVIVRGLN